MEINYFHFPYRCHLIPQSGQATTKNVKSMPLKHHPAHAGLRA
jgi:hypothetical protein